MIAKARPKQTEEFDITQNRLTMADYAKCKWCGKKFKKGIGLQFKSIGTLGLLGNKGYCSNKCKHEAKS